MRDILIDLTASDYRFLAGIIRGPRQRTMDALVESVEARDEDAREELCAMLEHEIRYLGSSDLSYQFRKAVGMAPGVSLRTIVRNTGAALRVPVRRADTDRDVLKGMAEDFATAEFARLPRPKQQELLENLGIGRAQAIAFLKKSAGVFAIPLAVEAFGIVVVQGLIKTVIFGIIARIIGQQLASSLLAFLFSRAPWWVGWIPVGAWTLSIGWTALTLQGPSLRKTIPIVLYLGLCCLRADQGEQKMIPG